MSDSRTRHCPQGRRPGRRGRPVWPAFVNDGHATADVADWIRAGGPGLAPLPPILEPHRFGPPRR
ncbi:hypothetical protein FDA94_36280 [Herbidospora galbida]|uniref:Uncharacterized protein n=1 Tax=Herbidospora galbida TaxID=2575442 RepID=A0A4U3LSK5_9ACTN|nr:hypothetical protein FDA94_36280 [Herbidospora galbida]